VPTLRSMNSSLNCREDWYSRQAATQGLSASSAPTASASGIASAGTPPPKASFMSARVSPRSDTQAESPHGFVVRNAFAVTLKPLAGLADGFPLLFRLRLVVERGIIESGAYRIDDGFKQPNQRRKLRFGELVDQIMRVLAILAHAPIVT